MINSVEFAGRLEQIMEYYGLTATALAEEMDFNRSTISHLVSGRNKPSLEFVMKVLGKFPEVKLDWLVSGKGTFPSTDDIESHKKISQPNNQIIPPNEVLEKVVIPSENIQRGPNGKDIDRIVVFYKDGTFKNYEN